MINNEIFTQKNATKCFRVQIDNHLNWKPQFALIMISLAKASGVLYRLKKYVSRDTLRMVYHALAKSRLQTCNMAMSYEVLLIVSRQIK